MKFKKIIVVVLSFVLTLLTCSCSSGDNYYLQLDIRPINNLKTTHIKAGEQLNEPIYMGLETDSELCFVSRIYVMDGKTKTKELSFIAGPSYSDQVGYSVDDYNVVDDAGNVNDEVTLKQTLSINCQTQHSGYLALQNIAGIHRIKFTMYNLYAYGIKRTSFDVSFLVEKDIREDLVEIIMDDSIEYEKIELNTLGNIDDYHSKMDSNHDVYYCKEHPVFRAKSKLNGEVLSDELSVQFRKLDENYYFNAPLTKIITSGIYLCCVHYKGTEKFRAVNYLCYIIL